MKINRKKFFISAAASAVFGYSFFRNLPSRFIAKISRTGNKLDVKINPSAVSRNKKEGNHA